MRLRTPLHRLVAEADRLDSLFDIWDVDGDGSIDRKEFARALKLMGLRCSNDDFENFCDLCDEDKSGTLDLEEIRGLLQKTDPFREPPPPPLPFVVHIVRAILEFLNTDAVQSLLYFAVVVVFQLLVATLRVEEEIFLDMRLESSLINNHFDSSHNTFNSMRRPADVWQWGNNVLWPALCGESGPACGEVGPSGHFASWSMVRATAGGTGGAGPSPKSGCNEDGWSDGTGAFGWSASTAWTVSELAARMNELDWTEGVLIRQHRVRAASAAECLTEVVDGVCLPELTPPFGSSESRDSFGYNFTHPAQAPERPFRWWSHEELGANPAGLASAHAASFRLMPPGAFASVVLPFFATTFLPDERGDASQVTDFRPHRATRANGRAARYFCVRLSWDGEMIHQLCDPNLEIDGVNRTTGVVRAAIEEFWNDLRRAHYLDAATRSLVVQLQLSSNSLGVASHMNLIFEFTSAGSVLTSYVTNTRVSRAGTLAETRTLAWIAFGFTSFFCALELIEACSGGRGYLTNMWNLMDWTNYIIFYLAWHLLLQYVDEASSQPCALLCSTVGYVDGWQVMDTLLQAKTYLSLCVCIQLLKISKFAAALVPKMGLAPLVLKKALPDLCAPPDPAEPNESLQTSRSAHARVRGPLHSTITLPPLPAPQAAHIAREGPMPRSHRLGAAAQALLWWDLYRLHARLLYPLFCAAWPTNDRLPQSGRRPLFGQRALSAPRARSCACGLIRSHLDAPRQHTFSVPSRQAILCGTVACVSRIAYTPPPHLTAASAPSHEHTGHCLRLARARALRRFRHARDPSQFGQHRQSVHLHCVSLHRRLHLTLDVLRHPWRVAGQRARRPACPAERGERGRAGGRPRVWYLHEGVRAGWPPGIASALCWGSRQGEADGGEGEGDEGGHGGQRANRR